MRFLKKLPAFFLFLFVPGVSLGAGPYFFNGTESRSLEELARKNPVPTGEHIKSIPLGKTPGSSIHLVQIRDRESPHIHRTHDLIVILSKGTGRLHIGKEVVEMNAGDSAMIPRGTVHWFENTGNEEAFGTGIFVPPFDGKDTVSAFE